MAGMERLWECSYTCKIMRILGGSGYYALQQPIGKAPIPTTKTQV